MHRTAVNPWNYPEGFDQGVLIEGHRRLLFVSGQCAVSPEGESRHPGDMRAQALLALENVERVLAEAGMGVANIVRMNTYVTDVDAYLQHAADEIAERLAAHDVRPPGVLAGIGRLARPDLLIELEAFAAD
ncbi:RidA family protein [Marinactinospora rubrisoli]|uniref:RidA family protein n=1 Tax=Marinactinospora rubrisoli TaxID=2715399 RepID=A0ABW2KDX5_9ACTN